jgi:predicted CXXCH cytochrome family protein
VFISALVIGCGNATTRYRVLSFFFDGVPDPNAATGPTTRRTGERGKVVFVHKPFADAEADEKKCATCHLNTSDIFARAQVRRDVCVECHASVKREYRYTHGPVVNNLCQFCHAPHQSINEHLLKMPAPAVCTQCHFPETLGSNPPEHLIAKSNCISCHSGHGGLDRMLLRPTTMPATRATVLTDAREVPP